MTEKELQEKKLDELEQALRETFDAIWRERGHLKDVRLVAERLSARDVEVVPRAEWIKDETYTGQNKEIYRCSRCDHYQTVKKVQKGRLVYLKRCPFCGAVMQRKKVDKLLEEQD